ncbi:MAG: rhodanese-like domain-containing protein [Longimicrobiales bacterium]
MTRPSRPTVPARRLAAILAAAVAGGAAPLPLAAQAPGTAPGMLVDTEWLAAHLDDPDVVVLHVTRGSDAGDERIPGARPLPLDALSWDGPTGVGSEIRPAAEIEAALEGVGVRDGQRIVIYGSNALGAVRAWMTLDVMGLGDRTSLLDGGFGAWREEGRPVAGSTAAWAPGSVTLRPRPDVVVDAEWILERLDAPRIALVDARPDDEYTGSDGGMGGMTNPGHIPGAHQLYWEELVESRDVYRLKDRDELRRLFEEAGAATGDTTVTYCMVGLRASMTYFVSRLLGYDSKFYDGSWHDWGARDDLPTVTGRDPG